jgi:hypothetical protein
MLFSVLLFVTALVQHIHGYSYSVLFTDKKYCFYLNVKEPNTPLHIYYSVNEARLKEQDGGKLLDFHLTDPRGATSLSAPRKSSNESSLVALVPGIYTACFYKEGMDRIILDVDLSKERSEEEKKRAAQRPTQHLEEVNEKLANNVESLMQGFRYLKNRERRNMETVQETHTRIVIMSIFEVFLISGMSILQVTIISLLFSPSRKPRV